MFSSLNSRYKRFIARTDLAVHSARGKNIILYILCLCAAFVFWAFLSLDTEVQRDFDVPVELTGVPDSITLIGSMPQSISATVLGKGSQLIRFKWGKMSSLKFRFDADRKGDRNFVLSKTQVDSRLRDYFGNGVQVMTMRPDSIRIPFTADPGKRMPIHLKVDVHPNLQYIISGQLRVSVDSVMVYSSTDIPRTLTHVETELLEKSDLKDTSRFEVKIKPIEGMRIIPDRVIVTIPVEPLIAKQRKVRVDVINMPAGKTMLTFPGIVEVTYLVPMSAYADDNPLKVYADYNEIKDSGSGKIPVAPGATPDYFRSISITPDSLEYVIEQIN